MSLTIPNGIYDGSDNFALGADGGRRPHLLEANQYEEGDNLICRGGDASTRPPILDMTLTFENPDQWYEDDGTFGGATGGTGQASFVFANGLFQEASYYGRPDREYLMASIDGRLYRIDPGIGQTASVLDVQLDRRNRKTVPINYHLQADRYLIVQDNESTPIVFDGISAVRKDSIPTGSIMGSGMGRLVVIDINDRIHFGDIFNGKGNFGADMLDFTEETFIAEGQTTTLLGWQKKPTAIVFIPQQDTSTGVGECVILGENGGESFFLSIAREAWKDGAFQRTALGEGIGNFGHRNAVVINQDFWFKSKDGWRSYRQARAVQDQTGQVPLSTNVEKWVKTETESLRQYGSAIAFNNRLLMLTTPYWNNGKPYHNGGLSLDFAVLSSFGKTLPPAWDGHWTERTMNPLVGLRALQLVAGTFNGKHRAFVFCLDSLNRIVLKELMPEPVGNDTGGKITARIRPKSYSFQQGSSPYNEKRLFGMDLWIDRVEVSTSFNASFRPDQTPKFHPVGETKTVTPIQNSVEGEAPVTFNGYSPRESIESPEEDADEDGTTRNWYRGYELQPEFTFTGRASIRRIRMTAIDIPERANVQK